MLQDYEPRHDTLTTDEPRRNTYALIGIMTAIILLLFYIFVIQT